MRGSSHWRIVFLLLFALPFVSASFSSSSSSSAFSCPNDCSGHGECQSDGTCLCLYDYMWSADCSQTRKELMPEDTLNAYSLAVVCLFATMGVFVLVMLYLVYSPSRAYFRLTTQASTYLVLLAACAARIAYYLIDPFGLDHTLSIWADRLLAYIYYPLIFTAYTLVLYFWARISSRASVGRGKLLRRLRMPFLIMNVVMYAVEIAITIVQSQLDEGDEPGRSKYVMLYQLLLSLSLLLILVILVYYVMEIHKQLKKFAPSLSPSSHAFRKILFLTIGTAVCILVGVLLPLLYMLSNETRPGASLVVDGIVQFVVLVAFSLIIAMLGRPRPPRPPNTLLGSNSASQGSTAAFGTSSLTLGAGGAPEKTTTLNRTSDSGSVYSSPGPRKNKEGYGRVEESEESESEGEGTEGEIKVEEASTPAPRLKRGTTGVMATSYASFYGSMSPGGQPPSSGANYQAQ